MGWFGSWHAGGALRRAQILQFKGSSIQHDHCFPLEWGVEQVRRWRGWCAKPRFGFTLILLEIEVYKTDSV